MGQVIEMQRTTGHARRVGGDERRMRRPGSHRIERVASRPIGSRSAPLPVERNRQHRPRPGGVRHRVGARSVVRARSARSDRRRAVLGVVLAALVACGIVLAHDVLAGSSGLPASASSSRSAPTHAVVTALPGDTLWAIAEQYRGDVPVDRYVDLLVRLNGGPSIAAGQSVLLP